MQFKFATYTNETPFFNSTLLETSKSEDQINFLKAIPNPHTLNLFLQIKNTLYAFVDTRFLDVAFFDSFYHSIKSTYKILRTKDYIDAGLNRLDGGFAIAELLGDGPHVHGIGHYDTFEAEFAAKFILQNHGRKRGWQIVASHLGSGYVGRHDNLRTGLDSSLDI